MTAFELRPASAPPNSAAFAVELRAAEPFLDHHRPGGHPLFGTVMGIELMTRAVLAAASAPPGSGVKISNVSVRSPIILHDPTAIAFVTVDLTSVRDRSFACTVETRGPATEVHFSASIELVDRRDPPESTTRPGASAATRTVDAAAIYSLFFHGPAFQVIDTAQLTGDVLISRVAVGLPDLTQRLDHFVADPRLIEAGLQTAGLLEIATQSKMMIPDRIDSIEFFGSKRIDGDLRAVARRSIAQSGAEAVDIDVITADQSVQLQVRGYVTAPLPFPADNAAIAMLSKKFHWVRADCRAVRLNDMTAP